jgi:hypothetical protein
MSGYRESSFDPNAGSSDNGPPMRPFNWVQWTGVVMGVVGLLGMVAMLAIRLFSHHVTKDDWIPLASTLVIFGSVLVNSRRQPGGLTPETRRKRMVIIAVGLMVFGAALITILVLKGA